MTRAEVDPIMAARKFLITIERVRRETYQMELEEEEMMRALDQARQMAKQRTQKSVDSVYSVVKIENVKGEVE